jgi:hypothetical protein
MPSRYEYRVKEIYYGVQLDNRLLEMALQSLGSEGFRLSQVIKEPHPYLENNFTWSLVAEREIPDQQKEVLDLDRIQDAVKYAARGVFKEFLNSPVATFGSVESLDVGKYFNQLGVPKKVFLGLDNAAEPDDGVFVNNAVERQIIIED